MGGDPIRSFDPDGLEEKVLHGRVWELQPLEGAGAAELVREKAAPSQAEVGVSAVLRWPQNIAHQEALKSLKWLKRQQEAAKCIRNMITAPVLKKKLAMNRKKRCLRTG
ncbi:hypothetical protein [Ralstonia solanacearum]|uniref:hypothetical protein n=1 Tax=Ralstonia solanacearum TaxID=305 RepID=UPI000E57AD34|nr:hypothetical protein [Ralstonia solanacearum]AXW05459.1 hypothetical protein CJO82_06120 [Ralstonia solanacearum]AXW23200.1 hypothetical protein CJO86_06125 [Ralstonia solanacearum]AXW80132.1 hypothetical protein CJO98_06355 [Ralstonia solanacearum]